MVQSTLRQLTAPDTAGAVFVPPLAPLVLLAFLGVGFVLAVSGVGAAVALAARRRTLARLLGGAALTAASAYGVALVGASLLSRERTLETGARKYFCEMDCHLAYSVVDSAADDGRRAVTVRTWFDPRTIASFRGDAPLTPNPREVWLEVGGRRVPPSLDATLAWRERHGERSTLADALRPGESYDTTFVFDAPPAEAAARLFVGDPPGIEGLLVGHENSPLHRRAYFALPGTDRAPSSAASAPRAADASRAGCVDRGGRS
jgi:hypothetical protein